MKKIPAFVQYANRSVGLRRAVTHFRAYMNSIEWTNHRPMHPTQFAKISRFIGAA